MHKRDGFYRSWLLVASVLMLGAVAWLGQPTARSITDGSLTLPEHGAYFGISVDKDAIPAVAADLEEAIGRSFKVQRIYSNDSAPNIMNGDHQVQDAALHSRIPWLSIKTANWASAATGGRDGDINQLATKVSDFGQPIIVTINYEPEDELNAVDNTAANFVGLWRRYVTKFAEQGVTNVTWAWVVKATSLAQGDPLYANATSTYPGDDYVDIIGLDVPNVPYDVTIGHADCQSRGQNEQKASSTADLIARRSTYPCQADYYATHVLDAQWKDLHDIVSGAYSWVTQHKTGSHDLPMALADYGTTYDWRNDPRRGQWITTAREQIKIMPLIKIVNYAQYPEWQLGWPSGNTGNDIAAFGDMGQDSYYKPELAPPPDTTPPVVDLLSPTSGTYEGTVDVKADASDDTGVDRVAFLANGVWRNTDYEAPYEFQSDTTIADNGTYHITSVAYDVAGNSAAAQQPDVVVANSVETRPAITSFTVEPSNIEVGQSTVLRWQTVGADGCSISPGGPQNTQDLSWTTPQHMQPGNITYELSCTNQFGANTQTADLTVTAVAKPPAKPVLGADRTEISAGDDVLLSWSSEGAKGCVLNPGNIESVGNSASWLATDIRQTTTFTLMCHNDVGQAAADPLTVTVTDNPKPQAPEILVFKAEPDKVAHGQTSKVTWQTSNVKEKGCNIMPSSFSTLTANGTGITSPLTISKSYTLTCVNEAGQAATASLSIIVDGQPAPPPPAPVAPAPPGSTADPLAISEEVAGHVIKVEYYVNGKLVQTATEAPFTFDRTQLEPGTHTVTQRIYFDDGSVGERSIVVLISEPSPWSWLWMAGTILLVGTGTLAIIRLYEKNRSKPPSADAETGTGL